MNAQNQKEVNPQSIWHLVSVEERGGEIGKRLTFIDNEGSHPYKSLHQHTKC